jgi:hypothetical protein
MFVVRCLVGRLSIILEKGSITLAAGQKFDLEPFCSRKWLQNNKELNRFIKSNYLMVTYDDYVSLPKEPILPSMQKKSLDTKVTIPVQPDKPVVINLDDVEDIEFVEALKEEPPPIEKQVLENKEEKVTVISIPDNEKIASLCCEAAEKEEVFTEQSVDLEKMPWDEFRRYVSSLGIICVRKSRSILIAEVKALKRAKNEGPIV